jgi:N-acyl-D-amino-acid deacylase
MVPKSILDIGSRRAFLGISVGTFGLLPTRHAFAETLLTGSASPLLKSVDAALLNFLQTNSIPGAAIAIGRSRMLLYARGFGVQDRLSGEKVSPKSLFRTASIAKTLTGVAIAQLFENNQLRRSDRLVKILALRQAKDQRWNEITIEHLLHHCAGFDRTISFDPMFHFREVARERKVPYPIPHSLLIDYMLDQPLDHEPGKKYAYSNFGYCLLGRVIEKVSGVSYEEYVQKQVWKPIGVSSAQIGRTRKQDRLRGEVVYHDSSDRKGSPVVKSDETLVPYPYGVWDVEAMDSHGGWVASAPQLVRFASELDQSARSQLLNAKSIESVFSRPSYLETEPSTQVGYGYGWQVRQLTAGGINVWHTGRLDGTAALLVRRHDGFNWAALFNTHLTKDGKYIIDELDPLMHQVVDQVKQWPTKDLFASMLD